MRTIITESPRKASGYIRKGGIVAFPTETVYGLGADIFDERAISKVFEAKLRPGDNPLIAHVADLAQISQLAAEVTAVAKRFIEAFFPGPLTIVLRKDENVPCLATAGLGTVGIRMPDNRLALEFIRECGTPLVAPSANLSGKPSPTTWQAVNEDLGGKIDCILKGEPTRIGLESTVVDCTSAEPRILRTGAVPLEALAAVVPSTVYSDAGNTDRPKSPGSKHDHYSPSASVVVVETAPEADKADNKAFIGLKTPKGEFKVMMVCESTEDYAQSLFEFFRRCDRMKIRTIYCEKVEATGMGAAIMDRLRRASAGRSER